jgi:DNA-binding transcriptional MerR regulator
VKISELARLSGVSTSTVKFYISAGLLPEPALKTYRNMAYYRPELAARIRTIKDLQQNHFLPLKLIGELLEPPPSARIRADVPESLRRKLNLVLPGVQAGQQAARSQRLGRDEPRALDRAEILGSLRITPRDLVELAALGFGPSRGRGERSVWQAADLEILQVIHETRELGLGDLFPLEILTPYTDALKKLVELELGLFRHQVLEGARLPERSLEQVARDATRLSERLIVAMRSRLLLGALRRLGQPTPRPPRRGRPR